MNKINTTIYKTGTIFFWEYFVLLYVIESVKIRNIYEK